MESAHHQSKEIESGSSKSTLSSETGQDEEYLNYLRWKQRQPPLAKRKIEKQSKKSSGRCGAYGLLYHKYDPEFKLDFTKKLESTQYSEALAVCGAWHGTRTDKLYEQLGWEILNYRRWYGRPCHFYNLRNDQRPLYLFSEIRQERTLHYSLCRPSVYEPNVKSREILSHVFSKLSA